MTSITNAPLSPVHENNKDYYNNEYICIHTRGEEQHTRGDIEREYTSLSYKQNQTTVRIHWNTQSFFFVFGSCSSHFWRGIRFAQVSTQRTRSTDNKNHDNGNEHKKEANQFHVPSRNANSCSSFWPEPPTTTATTLARKNQFFSLAHCNCGPTKTKDTHS